MTETDTITKTRDSKVVRPIQLQRYQCHKRVEAAKIESIEFTSAMRDGKLTIAGGALIEFDADFGGRCKATDDDMGYYVVYDDGYVSWSPNKAFEDGYSRIGPRAITTHELEGKSSNLTVECLDEPGAGGACHHYFLGGFHTTGNPSADDSCNDQTGLHILFQNGPIHEGNGVNGVQNEQLLAVLIDRMMGFCEGPYYSPHNDNALAHLSAAMEHLKGRTAERISRGVEGTHQH